MSSESSNFPTIFCWIVQLWSISLATMMVSLLSAGCTPSANLSGICTELGRPKTDDELIEQAVKDEMHQVALDGGPILYQSVLDFLENNPTCCGVSRDTVLADPDPKASRQIGVYRADVHLLYRWTVDPNEQAPMRSVLRTYDECGSLVDSTSNNEPIRL